MPSRRSFLRTLGVSLAGASLTPEQVLADPYRLLVPSAGAGPVRVRGRVASGGRGLGGVAVTDGFNVVETRPDGSYELLTEGHRPFVYLSMPSGYRIPLNPTGTARFYQLLSPGANGDAEASFELEQLPFGDDRHTALFLADIQTEDAFEMGRFHAETVPDVQATVRAAGDQEVVGVALGDIMFDDLSLYPEYERGVARMGAPFFQVIGNHDLDFEGASDEASTETFSRHFGPRYYSFDRGAVHYIVLDDVLWHGSGYIGYLGYEQLRWLEADLARVEPGSPVIVALHIPAEGTRHLREGERSPNLSSAVTNRDILYRLLEPFQAHLLAGHTHESDHIYSGGSAGMGGARGGIHEHIMGTVCGAWWSGDICADGSPNGYAVYEVDGEDIRWRYKSTGMPADHQLRVSGRGSDPRAPGEIVANVWDADEGWDVVWYEGGDRRGVMARRQGYDPRSVQEHSGEDMPIHRPWVDPYPTLHMYYAPVSPGHGEITVEATDRFGRVYRGMVAAEE